ncbi:glycosyltransferase family 2 protein [Candidatus Pelagibacter sp.]|nr:glycosyltransferase family 2 protein [Candidatus Pelagibacter sp.]
MENITIVILTYKTPKNIILDCLKSISKNIKILIVENSEKFINSDQILSEYKNVNIVCTGENLGYGAGNNFGIKSVKTDYILILNPDVICDKNFFSNISDVVKEAKDFSIIGCQYLYDKTFMPAGFFDKKKNEEFIEYFKNHETNDLLEVDWVTGCSLLINLKKFKDNLIFDENFFLYFEEFDLCKSLKDKGEKVYSSKKLKIHHLGLKSSVDENSVNKKSINRLREWHWMWSSFYFYKKNYNYFYALNKIFGKFVKAFFKLIFYILIFNKNEKEKYKYRFLGILNGILCRPSSFRDNNN